MKTAYRFLKIQAMMLINMSDNSEKVNQSMIAGDFNS